VSVTQARLLTLALACSLLTLASAPSTRAAGPEGALDQRAWELVSPADKNGGEVAAPAEAGAGAFRAAAQGGGFAFASAASFGTAAGAAPFSQYLASRTAAGWDTQNITPAHLATAYSGDPYLAFSADLSRALYLNPSRCPDGDPCPPGYQLRDDQSGALTSSPEDPGLFAGASADLGQIVFGDGTDLYRWSPPALGLTLINNAPASGLAAPQGAVSGDGSRVYWQGVDGNLYLREGASTVQVDAAQGGGGTLAATGADGQVAFFTVAGHLYRYDALAALAAADLAPGGDVAAVLAADPAGDRVFYLSVGGDLFLWRQGTGSTQLAAFFASIDVFTDTPAATDATATRLFFTSPDHLVAADTNGHADAYQLSLQGTSGCANAFGCLGLLSSGREGTATFLGASADGTDAYFSTDASLLGADPDSLDLYDARAGGGFPEPVVPVPCVADACQGPPPLPEGADPGSAQVAGLGHNATPPVRLCPHHGGDKVRRGRCQRKRHHPHRKKHHRRSTRRHPGGRQ
jgi:hypothetical protein